MTQNALDNIGTVLTLASAGFWLLDLAMPSLYFLILSILLILTALGFKIASLLKL